MNKKNRFFKLFTVLVCAIFLASCSIAQQPDIDSQTQGDGSEAAADTEADGNGNDAKIVSLVSMKDVTYNDDDYYSDWTGQNPNYIELNGTSASINGSGAVADGSNITISAAGVYVISGKLDNGQITIDVENKGTVRLVLNGMEIQCDDNAPIYIKNAEKAIITLQDGTQNIVSDGENYVFSDTETDEPNAAIFSKADLTINGTGTLTVHGNYNNGITGKDDLRITGGTIQIHSADDGIMGKDMVSVKDGNISIEAGGDGIKSTNDADTTKGFVALEGGDFDITSGSDAIQAVTSVMIANGIYNLTTGGGSANSSNKAGGSRENPWGKTAAAATATTENDAAESQSAKGIKSASDITISGGTFTIDSSDDAIHSNNTITITDGNISIASGDDGIHADSMVTINSGKFDITKSYEGIESNIVTVVGGDISIVASDDGINVAGGNDGSSVNGRLGENRFSSSGNSQLNISGGYIEVSAAGDGLDANGSIYMTNGTVLVNGPTNSGNGALDYDGVFEISGGLLIAAGSAGMVQAPSEQSAQYSVIMNFSNVQKAGNIVHLQDNSGNTVATFKPDKQYQSVVISSPELKKDTTYSLYTGGTSTGSVSGGLYAEGAYQGGTKITDFTISNSVTWMSESGETSSGGFNPGGSNPEGLKSPGSGRKTGGRF